MKQLIIAGVTAAMLLAAAGCGRVLVSADHANYLSVSRSKVVFVQWRKTSRGDLHGTITEGSIGGSGSAQVLSVSSAPFTGTISRNSVRLTFAELYFLHAHALGSLSGGGSWLTMVVPQSDGALRQVMFTQSDKARYDRAIAGLRGRIRHAVLLAAKQQASQRQQHAHAQAEQRAQSALNALYRDSSIALGGRLAGDLARLAGNIRAARSHLATERNDASGNNKYCSAALTVGGDAQAVGGAVENARGTVLSLAPDISAVRRDIVTATAYLRHLSKSGLPAPSLASSVIANADVSLKQAIMMANSHIDQINAIDAQARSLADHMATRACSGARSGNTPRPIAPIRPLPVRCRPGSGTRCHNRDPRTRGRAAATPQGSPLTATGLPLGAPLEPSPSSPSVL